MGVQEIFADAESGAELFCRNMRRLRKRKNLSLGELSAMCGVSQSQLYSYESGRSKPTLISALAVCKAMKADVGYMTMMEVYKDGFKAVQNNRFNR